LLVSSGVTLVVGGASLLQAAKARATGRLAASTQARHFAVLAVAFIVSFLSGPPEGGFIAWLRHHASAAAQH
jgi:hypothetical protein